MARLKKRIIKKPFVPFMIKLEAAVLKDGYKDIRAFVYEHIYKGRPFKNLVDVIKERYGIEVTYMTIARNLRKFAPPTFNIHTRFHFRRKAVAGRKGGEVKSGVSYFINEKIKKGFTQKEIAKALKISPIHVRHYLEKRYPLIDFDGNNIFPDKTRFGMKKIHHYYRWYKCAQEIGFDSVTDAIEYLFVEKKLAAREVAFIFKASVRILKRRIRNCKYLNERLNKTKYLPKEKRMALNQLVEPMYEETGYQKSSLQFILSKFPDCIKSALAKDKSVQINGLGTFSLKVKKARKGRNPATGEDIQIPEKTIVHFKMHQSLKNSFLKK